MIQLTDSLVLGWVAAFIWPFIRVLALFSVAPFLGNRAVPTRVRIALAALIALLLAPDVPASARTLDLVPMFGLAVQQVLIGLTIGFTVRLVFAAIELAGELIGLQMGLGFASFFDPTQGGQSNAVNRMMGVLTMLLFLAMNGHYLLLAAITKSFELFPVGSNPLGVLSAVPMMQLGAQMFEIALTIALPFIVLIGFMNLALGVMSRVAPQFQVFSLAFPVTVISGLVALFITLPFMQQPLTIAIERMLGWILG
ncbi:flagellar biosynthetic protein FliR [beta proteobacterium AAP99]|nr:flagellar biosynthetic protein FliR [beta proteobacterium AAP99]